MLVLSRKKFGNYSYLYFYLNKYKKFDSMKRVEKM